MEVELWNENLITREVTPIGWQLRTHQCYANVLHLNISLFIYALPLEIQLSREDGYDPINLFNPATFCACPKSGPGLPMTHVVVFLCSMSLIKMKSFVDIDGIDDHHYLKCLFISIYGMHIHAV